MSEKEIKKTEVAGKKIEDLTEEELEAVQGQGSDVNTETFLNGTIGKTIVATIHNISKAVCNKI